MRLNDFRDLKGWWFFDFSRDRLPVLFFKKLIFFNLSRSGIFRAGFLSRKRKTGFRIRIESEISGRVLLTLDMSHVTWVMWHESLTMNETVRNVKSRYIMVYLKWSDDFSRVPNIHTPYIFVQVKAQMKQFKIYEAQIRAILQRNLLPINYLSDSLIEINN